MVCRSFRVSLITWFIISDNGFFQFMSSFVIYTSALRPPGGIRPDGLPPALNTEAVKVINGVWVSACPGTGWSEIEEWKTIWNLSARISCWSFELYRWASSDPSIRYNDRWRHNWCQDGFVHMRLENFDFLFAWNCSRNIPLRFWGDSKRLRFKIWWKSELLLRFYASFRRESGWQFTARSTYRSCWNTPWAV